MEHTYLSHALKWSAKGVYYDENEAFFPLSGEVRVAKTEQEWTLGGFMEVMFPEPVRFQNDYKIFPADDPSTLRWESFNPALGTLKGVFHLIGNSMVSVYQSEDGVYAGTETLVQRDELTYYNVGLSFCNGKKMSAWTAELSGERTDR